MSLQAPTIARLAHVCLLDAQTIRYNFLHRDAQNPFCSPASFQDHAVRKLLSDGARKDSRLGRPCGEGCAQCQQSGKGKTPV